MMIPENQPEDKILRELDSYNILEITQQEEYEALTQLAAEICKAKNSFVTFWGQNKLWFESSHFKGSEGNMPYGLFLGLAGQNPNEAIVSPDLRKDERFRESPVMNGGEGIVFYAGVPLVSPAGVLIGLLNVVHDADLLLDEGQVNSLKIIGRQLTHLLELRKKTLELHKATEKLEKGKNKLKNLFHVNLDLLIAVDGNGVIFNVNRAVENLLGYGYDELVQSNLREYVHPEDINNTLMAISRIQKERHITKFKCRVKNKKQEFQTIEWQATQFEDGFLASGRDVTEQLAFELHLKNALALNNAITGALDSSTIVSIADLQGNIVRANRVFCQISGYTEEELLGQNHRIINSGFHPKSFWVEMWRTIARGQTWRAEVCNRAKDGSLYWVDTVINPILNYKGKIYQYYAIRYLITDRKKMENELREHKQLLEQIGQFSRVGGYEINLVNNTSNWSSVTKEIHEVPEDFVPDRGKASLFYKKGESRDKFMDLFTKAIRYGESFEAELQIITAKDNEVWVRVIGKPEMKEGKCERIYGTIQDINKERLISNEERQ